MDMQLSIKTDGDDSSEIIYDISGNQILNRVKRKLSHLLKIAHCLRYEWNSDQVNADMVP